MAWYYGTFSCGCEGRVNVIGPTKNRQWKADRKFEGLCEECYTKRLETDREKANQEAEAKAKEQDLPALTGTEKQIAWANTLRQKLIDETEKFISNEDTKEDWKHYWCTKYKGFKKLEVDDLTEVLDYVLVNETSAKFYIDNRFDGTASLLEKYVEKAFVSEEQKIEKLNAIDIKIESTVKPAEVKYSGIVEILVTNEKITAIYEKNEDFRLLVKELGYKWEGTWEKKLGTITGTCEDRAAELGNKLLNSGFSICIYDENIRNKAINGDFEHENDRWILIDSKDNKKIRIRWDGMNNKLYNAARKLPGSKWEDGSVKVSVLKYDEIIEFAEMYGFDISQKSIERLESYRDKVTNIEVVEPVTVEENNKKDGLNDILNSSRDILEDLLDD